MSFLAHQKLNTNLNQVHKFSKTQKFYKETIDAIANLLIHNSFLLTALNLTSIEVKIEQQEIKIDIEENSSILIDEEQIIIPQVEIEETQDDTIQQAQIPSNPEEIKTSTEEDNSSLINEEQIIIPQVEIEEIQDDPIQQAQIPSNPEEVNTDKKQKIIDSLRKE